MMTRELPDSEDQDERAADMAEALVLVIAVLMLGIFWGWVGVSIWLRGTG